MRFRTRAAAALAVSCVVVLTGCAAIPDTGAVQAGGQDVARAGDIGQIAAGPTFDAEPDAIVHGFLLAAQAGPVSLTSFAVANEYLTDQAVDSWAPYTRVMVTDGLPQPTLAAGADVGSDRVTVQATANVVASLDESGVFTEEPGGSPVETTFELVRRDGQWRISRLDDGLMIPSPVFGSAFGSTFHKTTLYFLTPDLTGWVPDVRWFPQATWRTKAVQALLAGPPGYLAGAATTALPPGAGLSLNSVTEGADGALEVQLAPQFAEASGTAQGLFAAQVRLTLGDGWGEANVTFIDRSGPVVPPEVDVSPSVRPAGSAVVLADGGLWDVRGRGLEPSQLAVALEGLDPTAVAVSHDGSTVVVRDAGSRLVRVTGGQQVTLLEGTRLLAPSIDPHGMVWSADRGGPLSVVTSAGERSDLDVAWLAGRTVTSVRVSPEGARVAVVSTGAGGAMVQVAGVVRDDGGVPVALAEPVEVGASVQSVTQAEWQDKSVLALLGRDESGSSAVFLAGVGGLGGSAGGAPRRLAGLSEPVGISGSSATGELLAVDADGVLYLRQSTALWHEIGRQVQAAAFPQ